jgi:putative MATE family efflux protein
MGRCQPHMGLRIERRVVYWDTVWRVLQMEKRDLTKGPVFQAMCLFAMPMIIGNILQQGYNVVDTWVVGHYVGPDALAAVGAAFALMTCLTSVLLGLCMGSGIVFSMCFGRRDMKRLEESICASFLLAGICSAALTGAALLGIDEIIFFMNVPEEIVGMTREYMFLVFFGIPAVAVYNFFGAYLKSLGNSAAPLAFLGVSTALNIAFDLLFVAVLGKGAAGAALATVLSQYASGIGIMAYAFFKNPNIRQAFFSFKIKKDRLKEIANYSVLTCLQQSVMNFGILMVQGLVNSFGTQVMAAFAAAVKIDSFTYMPAQEYANAFSTFIAQNVGAKKPERVFAGIRYAVLTSLSYCLAASVLLWFLAKPLLLIFIDSKETAIVAEGARCLHVIGSFYCGIGCLFLLYGLYRAIGKPMVSVALTVISLGARVGLSYSLAPLASVGIMGIWHSVPIGWFLADLAGILYYRKLKKQGKLLP